MIGQTICENCGTAKTSDESCPVCLLQLGASQPGADPASAPSQMNLPSVNDLNQQFPQLEVTRLVGRGGMGAIYHARQTNLERDVALKIIAAEVADDVAFLERFEREAKTLARLSHPNIVTVYDFGRTDSGQAFLIMEFVDGINLREAIQAKSVGAEDALHIVSTICDALQYAHGKGVVHRDIKPENILLGEDGSIKVADFGIAKIVDDSVRTPTLTATRQVLGSLHYLAPEHLDSPDTIDHRVDLYALGVVFYELLTGQLPLGRFEAPSAISHASNATIDEVVLKTLSRKPNLRYQNAAELSEALSRVSVSQELPEAPIVGPAPNGSSPSVPFSAEAMGGFAETVGVIFLEDGVLKVEHRTRDAIFGSVKTSTILNEIQPANLAHIEFKQGIFGAKIILSAARISIFDGLPGAETGRVNLKIKNQDSHSASQLIETVRALMPQIQSASAKEKVTHSASATDGNWLPFSILAIVCGIVNFGLMAAVIVLLTTEPGHTYGERTMLITIASVLTSPVALLQILGGLLSVIFYSKPIAKTTAIASLLPIAPAWPLSLPLGLWALHWLHRHAGPGPSGINSLKRGGSDGSKPQSFGATTIAYIRESRWGKIVAAANVAGVALLIAGFATYQLGYYPSQVQFRIVGDDVQLRELEDEVENRIGSLGTVDASDGQLTVYGSRYNQDEVIEKLAIAGPVSTCWLAPIKATTEEASTKNDTDEKVSPAVPEASATKTEVPRIGTIFDVDDELQLPTGYAFASSLGRKALAVGTVTKIAPSHFSSLRKTYNEFTLRLTSDGRNALLDATENLDGKPKGLILGLVINDLIVGVCELEDLSPRKIEFRLTSDHSLSAGAVTAAIRGPQLPSELEWIGD